MAILIFIAKLIISSGLFVGYYQFFLRNKRFHRYNRFYLLAGALLSLIIPFLHIPVRFFGSSQESTIIRTLKVINATGWEEPVIIYARQNVWSKWITLQNGLYFIYLAGAITTLVMLLRSFAWINNLKRKYPFEKIDGLKIYATTEPGTPFSFFRSIFWNEKISLRGIPGQQIFRHELFHVKEQHSADVLLMEILCCLCWFNPFYHLIKKEIKAIHEFLADEYAASINNRYAYAELLLAHAITQKKLQLAHPFFHTQIKRRIAMITQSNLIRRSSYLSRIMALPLLFILISAFAVKLTHQPVSGQVPHANKPITVVIDAGHGGEFPGANSVGIAEKNINLEIAKKIKRLSADYNVNIVLTRNNDKLVGNATNLREDLLNRVKISDEAKPDLFISIHVNQALDNNATATGFEAYISKKSAFDKTRQFASVILSELKNIYTTDEIIKQRDEGIIVIDRTTYPSILLECGYLTNPEDVVFITNASKQEQIARKILEGIVKYSKAQEIIPTTFQQKHPDGDTISGAAYASLNEDEIDSTHCDLIKNLVSIYFKNGKKQYLTVNELKDYYTKNPPRKTE
ncbi:MAG: M56/M15 family metallopeptidase [Chitinophagaceae bacterium]